MDGSQRRVREVLVGIDVGTTNLRAAVYDTSARPVALGVRRAASARPGGVLDPDALWQQTAVALAEAVAAARAEGPIAVRGIAAAGIGCIPVFLDAGGVAFGLAPDEVAREHGLRRLEALVTPAAFRTRTGYPFDTTTAACRLAAASAGETSRIAVAMSVSDFIAYRLTGVVAHDRSTAASMALWDAERGGWWVELIEGIGVDAAAFGTVVDSGQALGAVSAGVAASLGLPDGTLVTTGGHDYLTAALAAGVGPGDGILDVAGTLEIVATIHDASLPVTDDRSVRAMRDHHVVPGQRSYMVEAFAAGAIERLRPVAPDAPGAAGDPIAAAFAELDAAVAADRPVESTLASDLNPVIENLSMQAAGMVAHQLEVLGTAQAQVTVVGGGARSRAWNQVKADVLGLPVRVPRIREASALGAALLAGAGAGVYRDLDEAAAVAGARGADVVEPRRVRA